MFRFAADIAKYGRYAGQTAAGRRYDVDIGYSGGTGRTAKLPWRSFFKRDIPVLKERGLNAVYFEFATDPDVAESARAHSYYYSVRRGGSFVILTVPILVVPV